MAAAHPTQPQLPPTIPGSGVMYEPMGQASWMPLQKATMASLLPSSTAVIMEGGVGRQGSGPGMTLNPSRLMTSAARRPPLMASPVVWGPWNSPAGMQAPHD
jgi:hypothetical protein